jgi:hypothetical protein
MEPAVIRPAVVVRVGATAAQALPGKRFRVMREGLAHVSVFAPSGGIPNQGRRPRCRWVEDVGRPTDSSGILALIVGVVFAVLAIVGVSGRDVTGSLVLGVLALLALATGLILRRGSGRSPLIDLLVTEWIFAFFARLFASQDDWRLFVVAVLVANAATLASQVFVGRRRHRSLAEH